MNCAFCNYENNQIVKEHKVFELEWDDCDEPYFFEYKIGLCKEHQQKLHDFSKKQIFMNKIQLVAIFILFISLFSLILLKNFWGIGVVSIFLVVLIWYRNRPNKRYLRSEEDCVAYGYQNIQAEKKINNDEPILYFSKKEKERIFRI